MTELWGHWGGSFCGDNGTVVPKAVLSLVQGYAVHPSTLTFALSSGDGDEDPSWDGATLCSVPLLALWFPRSCCDSWDPLGSGSGKNSRKRQELLVCFQGLVRNPPTLSPPGSARTAAKGLGEAL